mgnify:CR=1 FL=1
MADGFLGRWSRRKQEVREGKPVQDPAPPVPQAPVPAGVNAPAPLAAQPAAAPVPPEPAAAPLPTLQDVQSLSIDSDFKPFASRAVAPEVRNAAMKRLFTDPHFNVMDGLDIYIDDYTQPSPLPLSVLRQMVSAKALGLVEDEEKAPKEALAAAEDPAPPSVAVNADGEATPDVAQSGVCNELPSPLVPSAVTLASGAGLPASQIIDAHADLRLQPDHAPPAPGVGHGAG